MLRPNRGIIAPASPDWPAFCLSGNGIMPPANGRPGDGMNKSKRAGQRGIAAIEVALALPFLVGLVMVLVETSDLLHT